MTTDNTVADILRAALETVTDADVPEALQPTAFGKAVDLLAAQAGLGPVSPVGREKTKTRLPGAHAEGMTLDTIASKLGVSAEDVGEVYHVDGDSLNLSIGSSKLKASKKEGTQQIALLIAAGRQAGGWDKEWTMSGEIRTVCNTYGRFDSGNFATTITGMSDVFGFSGSGPSRKIKVNRKGDEAAAALIRELSGGGAK